MKDPNAQTSKEVKTSIEVAKRTPSVRKIRNDLLSSQQLVDNYQLKFGTSKLTLEDMTDTPV
jgi:hypothetical protein